MRYRPERERRGDETDSFDFLCFILGDDESFKQSLIDFNVHTRHRTIQRQHK